MKTRVSYYREALSVVLNLGMSEIAKNIVLKGNKTGLALQRYLRQLGPCGQPSPTMG